MDQTTPDEATGAAARGPRWWQRAVPVTVLAALALVGALMALPEREIELSTSRKPQPFVELSLTGRPDQACSDKARLGFRMTSHLQRRRTIGYVVSVDPAGAGTQPDRRRGELRLAPGRAKAVSQRLSRPAGPYTVSVTLPGRPEQLRVHCRGERR